jgi:acyl-coenzyme A thioesterase PaaI-like protein
MSDAKYGGTMLDYCQKLMAGEVPIPPVAHLIGMNMAAVRPGCVVIELEAGKQHASPLGTVHGGILCAIAAALRLLSSSALSSAQATHSLSKSKQGGGSFLGWRGGSFFGWH